MNGHTKWNVAYGFIIKPNEDGSIYLKVVTESDTLEFDGINGNLMDASDFESCLSEHEDMNMTLDELIYGATEFLKDWGVDEEQTEAIIKDLTPWFEQYAIEAPTPDAWLKVLQDRIEELKLKDKLHREEIDRAVKRFREWVSEASDMDIIYDSEFKASNVKKSKETYTAVCNELRKAEAELHTYKETMHLI